MSDAQRWPEAEMEHEALVDKLRTLLDARTEGDPDSDDGSLSAHLTTLPLGPSLAINSGPSRDFVIYDAWVRYTRTHPERVFESDGRGR